MACAVILRTPLTGIRSSSPVLRRTGSRGGRSVRGRAGDVGLDVGTGDDATLARGGHLVQAHAEVLGQLADRRLGQDPTGSRLAADHRLGGPRSSSGPVAEGDVGRGDELVGVVRREVLGGGAGLARSSFRLGLLDAVADEDRGATGRRRAADLAFFDLIPVTSAGDTGVDLRRRRPFDPGLDRTLRGASLTVVGAPGAVSTEMIGVPTSTVSPSSTCSSVTRPANGTGSSTRDFAVSTSTTMSLTFTVSPLATRQVTISASVRPSPGSGSRNCWTGIR